MNNYTEKLMMIKLGILPKEAVANGRVLPMGRK